MRNLRGLGGVLSLLVGVSCGTAGLTKPPAPPKYEPEGQSKCSIKASQARPLIVEWPSADRLDLEAHARKGLVVASYRGCEMEVLRNCRAPGQYAFTATTRQDDSVVIRNEDELYAAIPVHAARFEGKLKQAGMLTVSMSMVGRYEADQPNVAVSQLVGDCKGATHYLTAITAGAFEFAAGAEAKSEASAGLLGAEAGGSSTASREILNRAGDQKACAAATADAKTPPYGCGAFLRVEVVALSAVAQKPPTPAASAAIANASTSSASQLKECQWSTHREGGTCVPDKPPSAQLYPDLAGPLQKAEQAIQRGDRKTAEKHLRETLAAYATKSLPAKSDAAEFAARAQFRLAEYLASDALAKEIKPKSPKDLGKEFAALKDVTTRAATAYDAVLAYKRVSHSLAALSRKGLMHENLAAKARAAKPPPNIAQDPELNAAYMDALDEAASKIDHSALSAYEQLVKLAGQLNVADENVTHAQQRIQLLGGKP